MILIEWIVISNDDIEHMMKFNGQFLMRKKSLRATYLYMDELFGRIERKFARILCNLLELRTEMTSNAHIRIVITHSYLTRTHALPILKVIKEKTRLTARFVTSGFPTLD